MNVLVGSRRSGIGVVHTAAENRAGANLLSGTSRTAPMAIALAAARSMRVKEMYGRRAGPDRMSSHRRVERFRHDPGHGDLAKSLAPWIVDRTRHGLIKRWSREREPKERDSDGTWRAAAISNKHRQRPRAES